MCAGCTNNKDVVNSETICVGDIDNSHTTIARCAYVGRTLSYALLLCLRECIHRSCMSSCPWCARLDSSTHSTSRLKNHGVQLWRVCVHDQWWSWNTRLRLGVYAVLLHLMSGRFAEFWRYMYYSLLLCSWYGVRGIFTQIRNWFLSQFVRFMLRLAILPKDCNVRHALLGNVCNVLLAMECTAHTQWPKYSGTSDYSSVFMSGHLQHSYFPTIINTSSSHAF